jgi:hypothetical protein
MVDNDNPTLLRIAEIGVPPYSARSLSQTLTPIAAASVLRRSLTSGRLINLAPPEFKKYKSVITCNDQQSPALDGIWPGDLLTIDCVRPLSFKTIGGTPQRTVVEDSIYIEGIFTFYRPRIVFMVANYTMDGNEYEANQSWQLDLEEL